MSNVREIKKRRGGPKAKAIEKALREKLGIKNADVWYEPLHGPCFEMMGYMGGWHYECRDTGRMAAIGHNFADAMRLIELSQENGT